MEMTNTEDFGQNPKEILPEKRKILHQQSITEYLNKDRTGAMPHDHKSCCDSLRTQFYIEFPKLDCNNQKSLGPDNTASTANCSTTDEDISCENLVGYSYYMNGCNEFDKNSKASSVSDRNYFDDAIIPESSVSSAEPKLKPIDVDWAFCSTTSYSEPKKHVEYDDLKQKPFSRCRTKLLPLYENNGSSYLSDSELQIINKDHNYYGEINKENTVPKSRRAWNEISAASLVCPVLVRNPAKENLRITLNDCGIYRNYLQDGGFNVFLAEVGQDQVENFLRRGRDSSFTFHPCMFCEFTTESSLVLSSHLKNKHKNKFKKSATVSRNNLNGNVKSSRMA